MTPEGGFSQKLSKVRTKKDVEFKKVVLQLFHSPGSGKDSFLKKQQLFLFYFIS